MTELHSRFIASSFATLHRLEISILCLDRHKVLCYLLWKGRAQPKDRLLRIKAWSQKTFSGGQLQVTGAILYRPMTPLTAYARKEEYSQRLLNVTQSLRHIHPVSTTGSGPADRMRVCQMTVCNARTVTNKLSNKETGLITVKIEVIEC